MGWKVCTISDCQKFPAPEWITAAQWINDRRFDIEDISYNKYVTSNYYCSKSKKKKINVTHDTHNLTCRRNKSSTLGLGDEWVSEGLLLVDRHQFSEIRSKAMTVCWVNMLIFGRYSTLSWFQTRLQIGCLPDPHTTKAISRASQFFAVP